MQDGCLKLTYDGRLQRITLGRRPPVGGVLPGPAAAERRGVVERPTRTLPRPTDRRRRLEGPRAAARRNAVLTPGLNEALGPHSPTQVIETNGRGAVDGSSG